VTTSRSRSSAAARSRAASAELLDRRRQRSLERRLPLAIAGLQRAHAVVLLGRADEVEEAGEGLGEQRQLVHPQPGDGAGERLAPSREHALPERDRGLPGALHQGERGGAAQLRQGLTQDPAEEPDLLAQPLVAVAGRGLHRRSVLQGPGRHGAAGAPGRGPSS